MVTILPQKYDSLAQVGESLSQGINSGLQESMNGQIERKRLASALKGFEPTGNFLQDATSFLERGGSPEQLQQFQGYLRQAALAKQASGNPQSGGINEGQTNPFRPTSNAQSQLPNGRQSQPPIEQPRQNDKNTASLVNANAERAGLQTLLPPTVPEIQNIQNQLLGSGNIRYTGPNGEQVAWEDATKIANQPFNDQQRLNEQAGQQQAIQAQALAELDKEIANKTQKSGKDLQNVITGEIQKDLQDELVNKIAKGMPKRQAIDEISEDALELNKHVNSLRNNIGARPIFGPGSERFYKDIESYRSKFSKYGDAGLNLFDKEIQNYLDVGPHRSALSSFKYSPSIKQDIEKFDSSMSPQQIAQMISKDLTNEDSIFGVGYGLYKKGINDQEVVDALNILSKNGFANFSPRQERELAEYYSLNYQGANTLGDILWDSTLFAQVFHSLGISKQKISPLEKLKIKLGKE